MLPAVDDDHWINSPLFKAPTAAAASGRAFAKLKAFIHYIEIEKTVLKPILKNK